MEWAERLPPGFGGDRLEIALAFDPGREEVRHLRLSAVGPRWERLLRRLREENHAHPRD